MQRLIRPACKALILDQGRILTLAKGEGEGPCHVLPGGGQAWGESFKECLERECLEELGIRPTSVGPLLFVRESYTRKRAITNGILYHRIDLVFQCSIPGQADFAPRTPDEGQVGIAWLALADLEAVAFYPRGLIPHIRDYARGILPANPYLGLMD